MEAEGGDVHGERVPHVEVKKHGVGGDEEGERLRGEEIEEDVGGGDGVRE